MTTLVKDSKAVLQDAPSERQLRRFPGDLISHRHKQRRQKAKDLQERITALVRQYGRRRL